MDADTLDPFASYDPAPYFCELAARAGESGPVAQVRARIAAIGLDALRDRARLAEDDLVNLGITFTVYSEATAIDRILPFDCIPRIITAREWAILESGVAQRVKALNLFLADIYNARRIIKDGVIPAALVYQNSNYRPEMEGFPVRFGTYVHICGIDLVRDQQGIFRVLEDNARTPSGVSYVIENRHLMLRTFPDLVSGMNLRPVDDYGRRLRQAMNDIAPDGVGDPQVVLLSPGIYNSAYFEHVFLAREMGVPLVEGADLTVEDDRVWMRTTAGLQRVHTIYRRISDDFLDPTVFRADSALGVPGLIGAWRRGNVTLANAVGTGVADDKAVYAYMPRIIKYYLDEDAILPNVDTHICGEKEGLDFTLANMDKLVIKPVGESGGYGITVGPRSSKAELDAARAALVAEPSNWISQPMIGLSVAPTLTAAGLRPRHLDLRPFAIHGSRHLGVARRTHSGCAEGGQHHRQFVPGRRLEGHLGAGEMSLHATPLLTRDAEGLFWMARYVERVENLARLIDVTQTFESPGRETESWAALVAINSDQTLLAESGLLPDGPSVKRFYLLDHLNPTSIPAMIEAARTNARKLRPLISTEMWMQLNVFHRDVLAIDPAELDGDALSRLCRRIKEGVQAHTGVTEGTFFRDQGWHFYELGRLIERADQTTRLLDIKYHLLVRGSEEERRVAELTQWNAVLRAAAGYHAFRRVAQPGFEPSDVVAFLLGDTAFARSVALCVGQMAWHLNHLRSRYGLRDTAPVLARLDELQVMLGDLSHLPLPDGLHEFLDRLQTDLNGIGAVIGTMFFRDWRPLMTQEQAGQTQIMR